jgi:hypothetical protein
VLVIAAVVYASVCRAESGATDPHSIAHLLTQLHATDWTARADAFEQLRSDPAVLSRPDVRGALLELLAREDQVIESALRRSHEQEGLDESFAGYVDNLGGTVHGLADWNDPRQVCIFVRDVPHPDDALAATLAAHGKLIAGCLIGEVSGADSGLTRAGAAAVLVQALAMADPPLDLQMEQRARETIRRALHDRSDAVRIATVTALADFGDASVVPSLVAVAKSDPILSLRDYTALAIARLQKRLGTDAPSHVAQAFKSANGR